MLFRCWCIDPKPGQSLKLLFGDLTTSIHVFFCANFFAFHIPDILPTLSTGRPPAVVQSPILFKRDGSALLWACGTCWLSAGSPLGYWGVALTAKSLEETLRTSTFHVAEGINSDVQSVNTGIHSAWRKASDRTLWRRIADTATLSRGTLLERKKCADTGIMYVICTIWQHFDCYRLTAERRACLSAIA